MSQLSIYSGFTGAQIRYLENEWRRALFVDNYETWFHLTELLHAAFMLSGDCPQEPFIIFLRDIANEHARACLFTDNGELI